MNLHRLIAGPVVLAATSCSVLEPGNYPPPRPPKLPVCSGSTAAAAAPDDADGDAPDARCARRRAEIKAALDDGGHTVGRCYAYARQRNVVAEGTVELALVIAADGAVTSACATESEIADEEMLECLTEALVELDLASVEGDRCADTAMSYPIRFRPR